MLSSEEEMIWVRCVVFVSGACGLMVSARVSSLLPVTTNNNVRGDMAAAEINIHCRVGSSTAVLLLDNFVSCARYPS